MQAPQIPEDDLQRIAALQALSILDTPPEERFDRLTRMARRMFDVPVSLVSLVDANRQWFKSRQGLDSTQTSRETSFCGHAILADEIFEIPDTLEDARFFDHPSVTGGPGYRFYAGCPLRVAHDSRIGTLCILDVAPRQLNDDDRALLRDLARMVEQELVAVQMATLDELTGLSNRRGFQSLARHSVNLALRLGKTAALLYFDLDNLKPVNDRFGHAEGDRAIRAFAEALQGTVRDADVAGRLGGDEFAVLLVNDHAGEADEVLSRLDANVRRHNDAAQRGYDVAYSVGVAQYDPARHATIEDLMREADERMYAHKASRRAQQRASTRDGR